MVDKLRLEFDRIVIMMLNVAHMPEVNDRISSAEHTVIQGGHGFQISALPIVPFPVCTLLTAIVTETWKRSSSTGAIALQSHEGRARLPPPQPDGN